MQSTLWQRFPQLNHRLCEEAASLHFSWVLLTLPFLLAFIPSSQIPAQEFLKWLQKPVLTAHGFQATAAAVCDSLCTSQSSTLKAKSPTKLWSARPAPTQTAGGVSQKYKCAFIPVPVPQSPQVQHGLNPFLGKTFHKSHTSLKFALFSWPSATSILQ